MNEGPPKRDDLPNPSVSDPDPGKAKEEAPEPRDLKSSLHSQSTSACSSATPAIKQQLRNFHYRSGVRRRQPARPSAGTSAQPKVPSLLSERPAYDPRKGAPPKHIALSAAAKWERFNPRLADLANASERRAGEEAAGCRPSDEEVAQLDRRLNARFRGTAAAGRPIDIVIGIDFGTSSTKIVARAPYEAGQPTFAVPALPFAQADQHPYLWASRLWLTASGMFSLRPTPDAAFLGGIKARLMAVQHGEARVPYASNVRLTPEATATAFLALQIRQAVGWLVTEKDSLLRRGAPRWSFNFGFPAASLDEARLRECYHRCIAAAAEIALGQAEVTLDTVHAALATIRPIGRQGSNRSEVTLHPEIAAAVAGFTGSMRHEDGLYALVDVGGSTVDCCTFALIRRNGESRCPIFAAGVKPLGVEPWRLCEGDRHAEDEFSEVLDLLQTSVIWHTKQSRDPKSDRWRTGLPVFYVGGGKMSEAHRRSAERLHHWLSVYVPNGIQDVAPLLEEEGFEAPGCRVDQLHRLIVAMGLSRPAHDIPRVELPAQIDDIQPPPRREVETAYIGKDQV